MTDPEPNHGSDSPALLPADDHAPVDAPAPGGLTHFDASGRAHMVDVGEKAETHRIAVARGRIRMNRETATVIREGRAAKGDVLAVAQIAAIMAAKKTSEIIPMCHPLLLTRIDISFEITEHTVEIEARVDTKGQTGVEMEALTAVSAAGLTIYDMVKAIDRGMMIGAIRVEKKQGGRSGDWQRAEQHGKPHEQLHEQLLEQNKE
jgi:cyclic pyranopterin phosphate synthase